MVPQGFRTHFSSVVMHIIKFTVYATCMKLLHIYIWSWLHIHVWKILEDSRKGGLILQFLDTLFIWQEWKLQITCSFRWFNGNNRTSSHMHHTHQCYIPIATQHFSLHPIGKANCLNSSSLQGFDMDQQVFKHNFQLL